MDTSLEVDQQLEEEQKNGYTWEEPLIVQNPYRYSPLTAVILFDTDEECEVHVTVKGKTEAADIEGTVDAAIFAQSSGCWSVCRTGKYSSS